MQEKENKEQHQLSGGTYEIIKNRLQSHKESLLNRLDQLNGERKKVFGAIETKLIANDRINTDNNCIARDIVTIGELSIFGYNVHFGLRTEVTLSDVFSIYRYKDEHFQEVGLDLIQDDTFLTDFSNLYKYYRHTIFSKFALVGNYLHMVFQLSEIHNDIKTFKWLIKDEKLHYVDNRSEHEYRFPIQHEFNWQEVNRDMHRYGPHPHISILDKVFVETIGGDLTIKIEDNTDDGQGIYIEEVEHRDQTLDDGQYRFADLGNLIILEIKPFHEKARYFVYNHKAQEVKKIDSIKDTVVMLPDDQGIIFPNGYYLQTGEYKIIDNDLRDIKFQQKISSPNGEDFLYVFYGAHRGTYLLIHYNVIDQEIMTPIICNGFTRLQNGELCYFRNENEQTKHHLVQIWQTPFMKGNYIPSQHSDSLLYKIGNKDIVKATAECHALITLLNKEDSYADLYADISKLAKDIVDSYYWISQKETFVLAEPVKEIKAAADAAIDEFEKVVALRKVARNAIDNLQEKADVLLGKIKATSFRNIDDFVYALSQLRSLRGEAISLKDIRYIDVGYISELEDSVSEQTEKISSRCATFLLDKKALAPYHLRIEEKQGAIVGLEKVVEIKKLEEEVAQIGVDLEMLIDIVSNLNIEDTSHTTEIIDNISLIFATLNQLKASIKNKIKTLGSKEAKAEFTAQLKLVNQSVTNYLDLADTPEKCDEYLNKISLQLEDLEGRFANFEEFITQIVEKREEVYGSFEMKKNFLVEARNKKALALQNASERILKGVEKKALSFKSPEAINGYFASDLMINKLRDIVEQLKSLDDVGKAEMLETKLKVVREDTLRKLKDTIELFEDGDNIIKLGNHKFAVNKQPIDLTIVYKDDQLQYHLTGTNLYHSIENEILNQSQRFWNQELVSENSQIYRASYLAYKIFAQNSSPELYNTSEDELAAMVKAEISESYSAGYIKGVHDLDALKILKTLVTKHHELGLLRYRPGLRAWAQYFWYSLPEAERIDLNQAIKASGAVLEIFPQSTEYDYTLEVLAEKIAAFARISQLFAPEPAHSIAQYLFNELKQNNEFEISILARECYDEFVHELEKKQAAQKFRSGYQDIEKYSSRIQLIRQWTTSFIKNTKPNLLAYADEVVCLELFKDESVSRLHHISPYEIIRGIKGEHPTVKEGKFVFDYHEFIHQLQSYYEQEVPAYKEYQKAKHQVIEELKLELKLEDYQPRVLSSFVRNKLIDQVYLPFFGDNLAKQIGALGDKKRTDRMGMLLLVSPPGYGKTTLMEYIANRLSLVFVKVNGPAIGYDVTSIDPMSANNAAAREELKKLNLAFEMGNNVMLYLDDIQHCNPEFLQKFISLADGTRRIEGVYNGQAKTYDLRRNKFCVVMAGNPYTESGEKFQIPDMLANRADIYNLGDIIGNTATLFKLSLMENALTSNSVLNQLSSKYFEDVYSFIQIAETGNEEGVLFKGNHTSQEIQDYLSVLKKVMAIRDTVLKVNATYIDSAAMEDSYRTEPAFKLQGSYRDMNKLVAKVVPVMNDEELQTLLLAHYESESQTLTSAAEANLLKYKELTDTLSKEELERWESIKQIFRKNNKLKALGAKNEMGQILNQMMIFSENLAGIKEVLEKGLDD